jgi:hypothetical protein
MRRLLILLALAMLLLGPQSQVRAQAGTIQVTSVQVEFMFGDHVTFLANIQPAAEVQEALVFFQVEGDTGTRYLRLQVGADGNASYRVSVQEAALRPFARINFWFRVTRTNGEVFTSPQFFFNYYDNRIAWQTMENGAVSVHWYDGDTAFGQGAFDAAAASLQSFTDLIPLQISAPVNVYIYSSAADLQSAIGGQAWVAGHASPDLGVVLVSITPGEDQMIIMRRQIPHEMAHVLLYQRVGAGYNQLPTWLNEGIASLAELYPNADYQTAVQTAGANDALLPLTSLCGPFPTDASGAFLAYAESDRVTRYIQSTYGTSALQAMVLAYANGLSCEQGTQRAIGISLSQLDQRWRQAELGGQVGGVAFQNLLPYLFVMLIILAVPVWGIREAAKQKTRKGNDVAKSIR